VAVSAARGRPGPELGVRPELHRLRHGHGLAPGTGGGGRPHGRGGGAGVVAEHQSGDPGVDQEGGVAAGPAAPGGGLEQVPRVLVPPLERGGQSPERARAARSRPVGDGRRLPAPSQVTGVDGGFGGTGEEVNGVVGGAGAGRTDEPAPSISAGRPVRSPSVPLPGSPVSSAPAPSRLAPRRRRQQRVERLRRVPRPQREHPVQRVAVRRGGEVFGPGRRRRTARRHRRPGRGGGTVRAGRGSGRRRVRRGRRPGRVRPCPGPRAPPCGSSAASRTLGPSAPAPRCQDRRGVSPSPRRTRASSRWTSRRSAADPVSYAAILVHASRNTTPPAVAWATPAASAASRGRCRAGPPVTARRKAWVATGYWSAAASSRSSRVSVGQGRISRRWDRSNSGARRRVRPGAGRGRPALRARSGAAASSAAARGSPCTARSTRMRTPSGSAGASRRAARLSGARRWRMCGRGGGFTGVTTQLTLLAS
jgi:hypothetical protein